MRAILTALLPCLVALMGLPGSLAAQHVVPESGEPESAFHYTPPSARQSVEIGNFYLRRKDYRGALSRYKEAAKDDPYYAPAYLGLGKVYEKMGKNREALAAYHKYLDKLPSEKQADEATAAHKAIRRLERQLRNKHGQSSTAQAQASTESK